MIIEYHRPKTLEESLSLLSRKAPRTFPLGGGTRLSRQTKGDVAVVDLQELGLDQVQISGANLIIGAATRLQNILAQAQIPAALQKALVNEGGLNYRNQATIAGVIVDCDGRSAFATAMLAMNAHLVWLPGEKKVDLGEYLSLRDSWESGGLIHSIELPMNGKLSLEIVARTPMDRPILCAAVCRWSSGRTRVVLGGYGKTPMMVMDGPEPVGADQAASSAYLHAGDEWASAEYRSQTAGAIVRQMIAEQVGG
jgi:CO/xanthine dehydrogenase FAD-binding subunit